MKNGMNRILVVNVNWVGDVLFSTPALRAIRKKYPKAYLACLVPPRCAELLRGNPYLNEVILCEDRMGFFELRKKKFDTAIFFHRSKTKVFLALAAGIPNRWGYSAPFRDFLLTKKISPPKKPCHKTDLFLNLLENLGIPSDGRAADFFLTSEEDKSFCERLAGQGILPGASYAVVHPGGNWDLKRWPASYFVEWIKLFLEKTGWSVILCGTSPEKSLCAEIESHFLGGRVLNLCGKTSLTELAVLFKHARLCLSNDSGPIHLAASQGTKIIGLYGPTSPALTGPVLSAPGKILHKDVGCEVPCFFKSCDTRVCMEWLSPEEVFQESLALLG